MVVEVLEDEVSQTSWTSKAYYCHCYHCIGILLACRSNPDESYWSNLQNHLKCIQALVRSIATATVHHMGPVPEKSVPDLVDNQESCSNLDVRILICSCKEPVEQLFSWWSWGESPTVLSLPINLTSRILVEPSSVTNQKGIRLCWHKTSLLPVCRANIHELALLQTEFLTQFILPKCRVQFNPGYMEKENYVIINRKTTCWWRRYRSESKTRLYFRWKIHRGTTLSIQSAKFRGKIHINLLLPGLTGMQINTKAILFCIEPCFTKKFVCQRRWWEQENQ